MKIIALMPVRNEAMILPGALKCLDTFCNHILIADQGSTDGTSEIARRHQRVTIIANDAPVGRGFAHGRRILLDAFRDFDGRNVALCLDADEYPSPAFKVLGAAVAQSCRPGSIMSFHWVQLWRSFHRYRNDASVWANSWKPMAFWDDRSMAYADGPSLHEARVPAGEPVRMPGFPVLHLQWAYWERTQYKQAWYRILEFIEAGCTGAQEINSKYSITLATGCEPTDPVPPEWIDGIDFPAAAMAPLQNWHRSEILVLFDRHGVRTFEPLQIWHIPDFAARFRAECGRSPIPHVVIPPSLALRAARAVLPRSVRRIARKIIGADSALQAQSEDLGRHTRRSKA